MELKAGQVVIVQAWWNNRKPVRCKISSVSTVVPFSTVQPLEGNPHSRFVRNDDVLRIDDMAVEAT